MRALVRPDDVEFAKGSKALCNGVLLALTCSEHGAWFVTEYTRDLT